MSRFLSRGMAKISPYVPGEQPRDKKLMKLNTNESPFPPSERVRAVLARADYGDLRLYPDMEAWDLRACMAKQTGLKPEQVFAGGGSDEVLGYAFWTFFDRGDKVYFPNITYGFYQVYADLFGLEAVTIPLKEDFTIQPEDYFGLDGSIFIANPNAPTGIALTHREIREILQHNPDRLVVIDEAYADFSEEGSCLGLLAEFDNLLVVQTFSKSRALAGMRLGFGFGSAEVAADLERIKYSFNPYNLDRLSLAVGMAAIEDKDYLTKTVREIVSVREETARRLSGMGCAVLPSQTNFLFVKAPGIDGGVLTARLRERGVLVRHFSSLLIEDYIRVSMGTRQEMEQFCGIVRELVCG